MADFPGVAFDLPHAHLSTVGICSIAGQAAMLENSTPGVATWPAANRAIYVPVVVQVPITVRKMAFEVAVQSGNCDVGIYDSSLKRLVSKGSTAVAAAGTQIIDIVDTALTPGVYFLAMCVDNTTASVGRVPLGLINSRASGVSQQAVGAVTLPDPAVLAAPGTAYLPVLIATGVATI